jgi:hypothetical protein
MLRSWPSPASVPRGASPFELSRCDAAFSTQTRAIDPWSCAQERTIAASIELGAMSTFEVRERQARYTGNMVLSVMGRAQRKKVQCFFCNRCYKAILPTWRRPSMVSTADLKSFAPLRAKRIPELRKSRDCYD